MMFAKAVSRALILALVALPAWAAPQIQTWKTGNGAKVLFVPAPELPMLDAQVVFDAGSARDGDTPGLASLTNALLNQGAGPWSADEVAERLEGVGAQLGTSSLRDMAWVSLRTLTREPAMEVALDTFAAVVARPAFRDEDIERLRRSTLVALSRDEQEPGSVGKKALYRQIYGTHPYAGDPLGTEDSVGALTGADIRGYHQRYYVAANAVVALVGDLSRDQAERVAERLVAGLPTGEAAVPVPPVPQLAQGVTERRDFPSTQTHIYIGQPGMRRLDPDYFPLYVGNHILGGSGMVSLLTEEVREKRGLSYSVYSYFLPMSDLGPFMMGLQTKNSQAAEAQAVLLQTLARFTEQGPTAAELKAAKQNITGGFPLRIASNGKIVQYLASIGFYGLPLDYLDRFNERVEAVTAEQIREAFQRRVHPAQFAVVIVGPQNGNSAAMAQVVD